VVIPCIYDFADGFFTGLALVERNGKWGYINLQGQMVIPCIYDGGNSFQDGLAEVWKDGKCGYINTQGEVVLPCIYDSIKPFSEGLAWVVEGEWSKWSIINTSGKVIVEDCDHWDAATSWSRVEF
jgi:serine/threonine-protein kinase